MLLGFPRTTKMTSDPEGPAYHEEQPRLQVIFLHGITGSRRFFASLEDRLRSDPTRASTLSFDLPGFGDNKDLDYGYTAADQLRFITKLINERFPSGEVILIGHSLGGVLALAWAAEYLPRASRLVLLNTPLGESRDDIVRSLLRERMSWAALLLKHRLLAHLACLILRRTQLMRALRFMKPSYVSDEVFRDYGRHSWRSVSQIFDQVLLRVPGGPLVRQLQSIPILNLIGKEDDEISRRTIGQPNVENLTLPGGHLMLLEHPVPMAQVIERFLIQDGAGRIL